MFFTGDRDSGDKTSSSWNKASGSKATPPSIIYRTWRRGGTRRQTFMFDTEEHQPLVHQSSSRAGDASFPRAGKKAPGHFGRSTNNKSQTVCSSHQYVVSHQSLVLGGRLCATRILGWKKKESESEFNISQCFPWVLWDWLISFFYFAIMRTDVCVVTPFIHTFKWKLTVYTLHFSLWCRTEPTSRRPNVHKPDWSYQMSCRRKKTCLSLIQTRFLLSLT